MNMAHSADVSGNQAGGVLGAPTFLFHQVPKYRKRSWTAQPSLLVSPMCLCVPSSDGVQIYPSRLIHAISLPYPVQLSTTLNYVMGLTVWHWSTNWCVLPRRSHLSHSQPSLVACSSLCWVEALKASLHPFCTSFGALLVQFTLQRPCW